MIERDLIEALEEPLQSEVKNAIMTLMESGVILEQRQRNLARITAVADTDTDSDLLGKLRAYRVAERQSLALEELAEQFTKERDDAYAD